MVVRGAAWRGKVRYRGWQVAREVGEIGGGAQEARMRVVLRSGAVVLL